MNVLRPLQQSLRIASRSRAPSKVGVRQWHPTTLTRSHQPRRSATTTARPSSYKPRSPLRPPIWALVFGCTGFAAGKSLTYAFNFFDHIERDSEEDRLILASILQAADQIPVVQQMLMHEGDVDSEWDEIPVEPHEGDVLLTETLGGSMGVVTPRAFWNGKESELWMVVHYGGALCGWPGIAHGGCTATVLLEGMGRALNTLRGARHNVDLLDPEHLGLTYLKPVKAGSFYLLKAKLKTSSSEPSLLTDTGLSAEKDLAKKVQQERGGPLARLNNRYDIDCVLESLDGVQCMQAKGVWDLM